VTGPSEAATSKVHQKNRPYFTLQTQHFQRYKQGTLHMVKSLELPTMQPLDPGTMQQIFKKMR